MRETPSSCLAREIIVILYAYQNWKVYRDKSKPLMGFNPYCVSSHGINLLNKITMRNTKRKA
eukprot:snap_masked-scaffold_14-processed-gene-8.15-mRNA-1 protein AED:1.00 eAED:1.00 QI:0/-1/0/0/-1/1/1/0/61